MGTIRFSSGIGELTAHFDRTGFTRLLLPGVFSTDTSPINDPEWLQLAFLALSLDISSYSSSASIPVSLNLTRFQYKVMLATREIPAGQVVTYGAIAAHIGHSKAVRAVGTALSKNPVPLIIPCHRVVRANGSVGKFSTPAGTAQKCELLRREGISIQDNKLALSAIHARF
jgi:O-6-methylguanine DNA methyltransferase